MTAMIPISNKERLFIWLGFCLGCVLFSTPAHAADYRTCLRWDIQTVDSGFPILTGPNTGLLEDKFSGANSASAKSLARGIRVDFIEPGGGVVQEWADSNGCVQWQSSSAGPFTVKGYKESKDSKGNRVRLHSGPQDTTPPYGLNLVDYSFFYYPSTTSTTTVTLGTNGIETTAVAMAAYTLSRYNQGLSNMEIEIGMYLDPASACSNSAHWPDASSPESNLWITSGLHHLTLEGTGCSSPGGQRKYTVAHEMAHAMLALYYGKFSDAVDGFEPNTSSGYAGVASGSPCNATTYSIFSAEWSSISFREAFAHYVATRVFNDKATTAAFRWFGVTYDVEFAQSTTGSVLPSGGWLENVCCVGCSASTLNELGTIEDWLRFLWDMHTNTWSGCPHNMTKLEMLKLYRETRRQVSFGGSGSTEDYYNFMTSFAINTGADSCLVSAVGGRILDAAELNGIDN